MILCDPRDNSSMDPYSCRELMPRILRSREYHLYDQRGRRYLDLYQGAGTALLGHRPEGLSNEIKNVLSRGLWAEYPSIYTLRMKKQLTLLIPEHPHTLIFSNRDRALVFISNLTGDTRLIDPALEEIPRGAAALWRPLCPAAYEKARVLLPVLPFPGHFAPAAVCCRAGEEIFGGDDECSPVLLAGLVRAAVLLARRLKGEEDPGWKRFDRIGWPRRGPYLRFPDEKKDLYRDFFTRTLAQGFILPPHPCLPLILPPGMSSGEEKALLSLLGTL